MNNTIRPGDNFYKYANGKWQQQNPIPPAYSRWDTFEVLQKHNDEMIKNLIMSAADNHAASNGSIEQKIRDFYLSGMDEKSINKAGIAPLQPEFKRISAINNLADLQSVISHLQMLGVNALFGFSQMQDFKDSRQVIGVASQGGLGLPDRDYYLKNEDKFKKIREIYLHHIAKMFELQGETAKNAMSAANTVMKIESMLAKASMAKSEIRDPHSIYHPKDIKQLQKMTPNFSWSQYFKDLDHPEITHINLAMPTFFVTLNSMLGDIRIDEWKIYLRWHLIDTFAPYLSQPYVEEDFRLNSALTGTKQLLPRWHRVVNTENALLGFAIGKSYVEKYFPPFSKQYAQQLVDNIRASMKESLRKLSWMSDSTRDAAIRKLDLMTARIGYPDKWLDYSTLTIDKHSYVLNVMRSIEFLSKYELDKIGKPVDAAEWDMTPQTINAYYDPSMNRINIPAGILQPPFFDAKAASALNYGAIGSVIGHEMTHAFDDEGAQFDGQGNMRNWWTDKDFDKFRAATKCIAEQYSKYRVDDNLHLQGNLVVGEATADLGGMILAYRAFHATDEYKNAKNIAGFTPDQQFFLSDAFVWAANIRPKTARLLAITDPHPPAIYRVNGTLANMPEFRQAFHLPTGSPMVNKTLCTIW
jgi:putative endopeptidase